jgi:hypothetical protein
MDKELLKATVKLWERAAEEEFLADLESSVVLGAHYAKLALEGTVALASSGESKVKFAYEVLKDALGED